jgi:glycosyltransferase involved in cell wall biosynthesis
MISAMPEVSVVVPTHNRRVLLQQTLRSILGQRGVDFEVIVVDDGSSDGTTAVITGLGHDRVRLVRHPTARGLSAARNRGVAEATGPWLAFCDDDDLWAPDKLARQLQAAAQTGASWVYTGEARIDLRQRIVGGTHPPPPPEEVAANLPHWNLVPGGCSGVIASAAAVTAAGGYDTRLSNLADWDLWIRLARGGLPARVSSLLVGYRLHAGSASRAVDLLLAEAEILDRCEGVAVDRGRLQHYLAVVCLRSGRRRDALRHLAGAARHGRILLAGETLAWIALERLPSRLLQALRRRQTRQDPWRAEAEAWLAELR